MNKHKNLLLSHACIIMLAIATTQTLPETSPSRDPFFLPTKNSKANHLKSLKLIGTVTSNNKLGAIIENNKKQKIIFTGDTINNYTVQKISKNKLSLTHKNTQEQISLNFGGKYEKNNKH